MAKRIVLTSHAQRRLHQRGIQENWVAAAAFAPERIEPEPRHAGAERRFRAIPEFGGRILRVTMRKIDVAKIEAARRG